MRRCIFALASAVSLLLFLMTVVLVRSNWVGDLVYWDTVDENGVQAIYGIESASIPIGSRFGYVSIATSPPLKPSFSLDHSIHVLIGHSALGKDTPPR